MSALNILDRFAEDYEGGHPVEYALPIVPGSKKAKEIEKIMGGVSRKVRSNAKRSERQFRGAMRRNGFTEIDNDVIRNDFKNYIREHQGVDDGFAMAIKRDALDKVMSGDGQFKNQFQLAQSGGYLDPYLRSETTKRNFGTRFKEKDIDVEWLNNGWDGSFRIKHMPKSLERSEKYGFHPMYSAPNSTVQYGDYRIEFNPTNMENRTTLSIEDSLDNPSYPVLLNDESTWANIIGDTDFRYYHEGPYKAASELLNKGYNTGYRELQYHGPVGLDDVDRVVVPNGVTIDQIPDQWKLQAEANRFDIVNQNGDVIYKSGQYQK